MYKARIAIPALFFGLALAGRADAAVIINEIAWMGTANGGAAAADSADEWIELANTSEETVSLAGWTLRADDGVPTISLSGTILPGGFFLIERTDDESVRNVPADLVRSFGNGLSNAGETLVLINSAGETVDTVEGGEDWEGIGGDATTKHTPQRTGLGWITAAPTPRAENAPPPEGEVSEDPSESEDGEPVETVGGSSSVYTPPPYAVRKLFIFPGPNRVITAGAETPFRANVYDGFGRLRENAEVTWAFGNGVQEKGTSVTYAYDEPGEYLVVVRARTGSTHAIRTLTVVVEEASVSLSTSSGKGIHIRNEGKRILDLSRWVLEVGEKRFTIPEDTALLPGGKVLFTSAITRLSTTTPSVSLYYPGEKQVAASSTQPFREGEGNQG